MVYSVNQSVLDIVKTAWVVITLVVCVTTDVKMVGLDQTVTKVVIIEQGFFYRTFDLNNIIPQS